MNSPEYVLIQHLREIKTRISYVFASFILTFMIIYEYKAEALYAIIQPLSNVNLGGHMIYTSMSEGFLVSMKLTLIVALLFILPCIVYQLWLFISPGLHKEERAFITSTIIGSMLFVFMGYIITYNIIIPHAWKFFLSFETHGDPIALYLEARVLDYLAFILRLIFILNILSQVPIMILVGLHLEMIQPKQLINARRLLYLIALIIATLFSPPDIFSQLILWFFLISILEISLLIGNILELIWKRSGSNR